MKSWEENKKFVLWKELNSCLDKLKISNLYLPLDLRYFKLWILLDQIEPKFMISKFQPSGCKDSWIRKLFLLELFSFSDLRPSDLDAKMTMNDSQQYPWKLYRINNVEDIFVFLFLKVFNSDNSYIFSRSRTLLLWRNHNWKILVFKIKNCENWSDHCELHNVSLYRETWRSDTVL